MIRSHVKFAGLNIIPAEGWCDITDNLPSNTPFSLAKPQGGIGVLQISVATYKAGPRPRIDVKQLEDMLKEFLSANHLKSVDDVQFHYGQISYVSADVINEHEFVRVWYVTDGSCVALITYLTSESDDFLLKHELLDASSMIQSIYF
jgi:hypothetical protein